MNEPRISVIVPFYNAQPYIEECIKGLLAQEYPVAQYEIIMVDNNSTDDSAKVVMRSPRIRLLSETRQGSYAARNNGMRKAKGDIIAFTDPDCIPDSDWLRKIALAFSDSDVGVVIGRQQFAQQSFSLSFLEAYENEKNKYVFNSEIRDVYFGHTNNMAVRKKLFEDVGPFIERSRGSDTIFVRQCVDSYFCRIVRYYPEIRVRHMEIDSLLKYFRKVFIYGNSRRRYKHIYNTRPLTNQERFRVFRRTIQGQRYSWLQSVFFFGLLIVGLMCWNLGSVNAARFTKEETGRKYPKPARPFHRRVDSLP